MGKNGSSPPAAKKTSAPRRNRDPGGTFRITPTPDGDLDVLKDGEPQYRLEQRPRELRDFEAMCWWQSHAPASHFTQSLVCSRLTEDGRVTLSGRTLTVTTGDDHREERELTDEQQVLAAYREHFGIVLDHEPLVAARPNA